MNSAMRLAVIVFCITCFCSASPEEEGVYCGPEDATVQLMNSSSSLRAEGNIYVDNEPKPTPDHPVGEWSVKLVCTSVEDGRRDVNYCPPGGIDEDDAVYRFLHHIPDLSFMRYRLKWEKTSDDSPPIASFTFTIVRRIEGGVGDVSDETKTQIVLHEQKVRTSGIASVVFNSRYDYSKYEDYRFVPAVLTRFCNLADDYHCDSIWVTTKMSGQQEIAICWPGAGSYYEIR